HDSAACIHAETGVGEADVPGARAARAVGLDRRLVGELAEQVGRGGAFRHDRRPVVLETVAARRAGLALRVAEAGNPFVAERLLRPGRVARALGPEECAAVVVPGDHWVAGARRPRLPR